MLKKLICGGSLMEVNVCMCVVCIVCRGRDYTAALGEIDNWIQSSDGMQKVCTGPFVCMHVCMYNISSLDLNSSHVFLK